MKRLPSISIVVPSFNQAQYIGETLQSLVAQEYPNLQVIIQDGGSSDGSVRIAEDFVSRFPEIFQLFVEEDSGQADAINRGFARSKGEILAFLNSDDTYYPRILHRVAAEIDPEHNRFIVMGRCLFTGADSRYVGVEHPAEYISHFEHLVIWKRGFNTIPQPSVFWHRSVLERCGGLDIKEHHALDYDLFCRFSKHFHIHRVDDLWSTFRMHENSKSAQITEPEVLDIAIRVSRKYWGSWLSPLRWRCEVSYWFYSRQYHERACYHARRAETAKRDRRLFDALLEFLKTLRFSPVMARDRLFFGWLASKKMWFFEKLILRPDGFTGRYDDAWIGPLFREKISVPTDGDRIIVTLTHHPQPTHSKIKVQLSINGSLVASKRLKKESTFSLITNAESYRGKTVLLEIRTNSYFVPHDLFGTEDKRSLSLRLVEISTKSF